jgi:hypothetical protein
VVGTSGARNEPVSLCCKRRFEHLGEHAGTLPQATRVDLSASHNAGGGVRRNALPRIGQHPCRARRCDGEVLLQATTAKSTTTTTRQRECVIIRSDPIGRIRRQPNNWWW